MNKLALSLIPLACLTLAVLPALADDFPSWAYPVNPPAPAGAPAAPDDGTLRHVPDTSVALTRTQIAGRDIVPDWHPEEHPPMPDIVAKGRGAAVRACAYCHQPSGSGRPENAALNGLTANYIREQVGAFKAGNRNGSEPKRNPQNLMLALAKNVSESEIEDAAAYFSSLKPTSFVKVVESATAPKTNTIGGMLTRTPDGAMEPLGNRIIEVPDDTERGENRDPRTPFTAYVPKGSLAKGKALVTDGANGKTIACAICHGPDLNGVADIPRLAGRSPSYIMRQLYDIQHGTRSGNEIALMKQVVDKLDQSDMVAIAAYVASQKPK